MTPTGMTAADAAPFTLRRATGTLAEGAAKLGRDIGSTAVEALLAQANRRAVRKGAPATMGTMNPRPGEWYAFDEKDQDTADWYPQGLTCGADSGEIGVPVFAATWYFKPKAPTPERGVRVSFLSPTTLRYQHALLVEAGPDGAYRPIDIHAGGVAWFGDLLYVADTARGLRVFDVGQLMDLKTAQNDLGDPQLFGRHGGKFHAFGYRYLIPQTDFWRVASSGATFSFVSLDRSGPTPLLVSGEYVDNSPNGRVVRWELGSDGSLAGLHDCFTMGVPKIQGAVSRAGTWYLSQAADAATNGKLLTGRPGKLTARPFPIGPEDLTVQGGKVWSVTEFRNKRVIFGVSL
ncbi:hypothetical protein OIE66_12465 [Nonomuraea sp. NBC_01738]|uniref:hypothetical protein n=1 Tax=Nonomuraea sp. NBC_01738 TaxID=2976003 RepID=UPI002E13844E|nr:hypothetical protein OIE66_12465 [Nonomuraea sp. NBC_01738]